MVKVLGILIDEDFMKRFLLFFTYRLRNFRKYN